MKIVAESLLVHGSPFVYVTVSSVGSGVGVSTGVSSSWKYVIVLYKLRGYDLSYILLLSGKLLNNMK